MKTGYTYAGPITTVTAPNGATTTTTTDMLGRTASKVISPDSAHATAASQETVYTHQTMALAA